MKQRIAILSLGLALAACSTADNAANLSAYYAATQGLNQGALKTALYEIIKNPRVSIFRYKTMSASFDTLIL